MGKADVKELVKQAKYRNNLKYIFSILDVDGSRLKCHDLFIITVSSNIDTSAKRIT